jgi:hypothetical protein
MTLKMMEEFRERMNDIEHNHNNLLVKFANLDTLTSSINQTVTLNKIQP